MDALPKHVGLDIGVIYFIYSIVEYHTVVISVSW